MTLETTRGGGGGGEKKSHKNHAELPLTLTVKQVIAELLNISLPVAYELTKRADFSGCACWSKKG